MTRSDVDAVRAAITLPASEARPMVRWWWFGGAIDEAGIEQQLQAMADAGLGGAEASFVYPLHAQPADNNDFLTPRFLELVGFAARTAAQKRLRFDLTLGSGWSYGGRHVPSEHAAKRLRWEQRTIGLEGTALTLAGRWPGDELVAAYIRDGAMEEARDDFVELRRDGDVVEVPAGRGPRTILIATSGLTGQLVKRSGSGAEGPVLDHYSDAATRHHLAAVAEPLLDAAGGASLVGSVFCDSLETYHSDWTPDILREFQERRGYDARPHLFHLFTTTEAGATLRADYHRTLSELYEDRFLAVIHAWAKERAVPFRVQNYGHPPARVSGYRHADMIEGEGWGWDSIPQTKWASSAAHHLGVDVVSSETWTWANSPSFRARPVDLKAEAHEHALSGINQFIGHGWPSSPSEILSPGWAFYASTAITDRNAWWPAAPDLFAYLTRLSAVMRLGTQVADIGLWLPYDDAYASFESGDELNLWQRSARRLGDVTGELRRAGHDFDVIDGELPLDSVIARHRVIVVAHTQLLNAADSAYLSAIAAAGTTVIAVDSELPDVPAAVAVPRAGLLDAVAEIVAPDAFVDGGAGDVAVVHRRVGEANVYLVVNTGAEAASIELNPRDDLAAWEAWDLADTRSPAAAGRARPILIDLAPYEARVVLGAQEVDQSGVAPTSVGSSTPISHWTFTAPGSEAVAVEAPHVWEAVGLDGYAGAASYRAVVTIDEPGEYELAFADGACADEVPATQPQSFKAHVAEPVGVVALVHVAGAHVGTLWAPPYALRLGALPAGDTEITLTIANTSVGAMRDPRWQQIYRDAANLYGARFAMQDMDQVHLPTRSGLLATPVMRRVTASA